MGYATHVPLSLILARAVMGPVVVLAALVHPSRIFFGTVLVLALASDIFDGIIARRLHVATATLRRLDSAADTLFYVGATVAAWRLYPDFIRGHARGLLGLALLEVARYAFDFAKFRREASYHMWSSKVWGIVLFAGFFALLALGEPGIVAALPIYVGIVVDIEGLAISITLREWRADVPSIVHALRWRAANPKPPAAR